MRGRTSETSAISIRPANSGKNRSRAVSRSAASTGLESSPSVTLAKLIEPVGNSETVDVAAQHQIEPGDAANLGLDRVAHALDGNEQRHRAKRGKARQHDGGDGDA